MKIHILLLIFILVWSSYERCKSYGIRLQYGNNLINKTDPELGVIFFNTDSSCNESFVTVSIQNGLIRDFLPCFEQRVQTNGSQSRFVTYIQKCPLNQTIKYDVQFAYTVYGVATGIYLNERILAINQENKPIRAKLANPHILSRDINILTVADWSKFDMQSRVPIFKDVLAVKQKTQLHLIIVVGDIAYDLKDSNGQRYRQFFTQIQKITSLIPVVFVPGNHEHDRNNKTTLNNDNMYLYSKSFYNYGIVENLATGFKFGQFYILLFDPYSVVYGTSSNKNPLEALNFELTKGKSSQKFIVPFSHYPLMCSGQFQCKQRLLGLLRPFFKSMIDSGVSLYIGAHIHDYQRSYPYTGRVQQQFLIQQSPYYSNKKYLISIIEGVGGSDGVLNDVMENPMNSTAKYTLNQTGFGLLSYKYQENSVFYKHFSTKIGNFMDQIQIKREIQSQQIIDDGDFEQQYLNLKLQKEISIQDFE